MPPVRSGVLILDTTVRDQSSSHYVENGTRILNYDVQLGADQLRFIDPNGSPGIVKEILILKSKLKQRTDTL